MIPVKLAQQMKDLFLNWWCEKFWPLLDPQKQYFGIQLDITNACNLACSHCYHNDHKNTGALSYEEWLHVLDQYQRLLKKFRMFPRITICGGEPLLCPFLFPLLQEIRNRFSDCRIFLLSNGTLISDEIATS